MLGQQSESAGFSIFQSHISRETEQPFGSFFEFSAPKVGSQQFLCVAFAQLRSDK
ncbi:hypothetical protein [Emticicia oligotrophica]|uniref:hypothetical protein n=1 Tax=Emticicia oligotrophica TaxID=312279 RepID=UPI0030EBA5C0